MGKKPCHYIGFSNNASAKQLYSVRIIETSLDYCRARISCSVCRIYLAPGEPSPDNCLTAPCRRGMLRANDTDQNRRALPQYDRAVCSIDRSPFRHPKYTPGEYGLWTTAL